jgi:aminopeptidase
MYLPKIDDFSEFCLERLLTTCFGDSFRSQRFCILIDLPDPNLIKDFRFLDQDEFSVQKYAISHFFNKLSAERTTEPLISQNCDLFAFKSTGGSNLDPEDTVVCPNGNMMSLSGDVCPHYDIILAITDYSLTAPLTSMAKKHGFRGATLHGLNETILNSGLSVDYHLVSNQAECVRTLLTQADDFTLHLTCLEKTYQLTIQCSKQEAQKSHGLCPPGKPDVANLPAGEVYFVPQSAEGEFPFRFDDGTLAVMHVENGSISQCSLLQGDSNLVEARNKQLASDPATGIIGELGFGTQLLPFSGKDIQDEKILGTCHVATGRSDHLGGHLTPDLFNEKKNASHDDILFAPLKTPEIVISKVIMKKNDKEYPVLEDFYPSSFLLSNLADFYPTKIIEESKNQPANA